MLRTLAKWSKQLRPFCRNAENGQRTSSTLVRYQSEPEQRQIATEHLKNAKRCCHVGLTAWPLSCAEATRAEGAADEVRCARGASAPGRQRARRRLQRLVRRRIEILPPRVFANCRKYPTRKRRTQSFAERLRSRPRERWPTRSVRRATPPAALRRHAAASCAELAATYLIENAQLRFSERLCRHGRCGSP